MQTHIHTRTHTHTHAHTGAPAAGQGGAPHAPHHDRLRAPALDPHPGDQQVRAGGHPAVVLKEQGLQRRAPDVAGQVRGPAARALPLLHEGEVCSVHTPPHT